MEGAQKKTAVPKNDENPKQSKMSTLDIIKRAIQATGLPKKGASFVNIKKFASELDGDADPKRQARSIKLALKKGLEKGDLIRPNQCKNSVGATGSFLLRKKVPEKKSKIPKKIKESDELIDQVKPEAKSKVKTKRSKQETTGNPETLKISKSLPKRKVSIKVLTSPEREKASRPSSLRKSLLVSSGKKILDKYAKIRKQKILANATMAIEPRKSVTEKPKINWTKKGVAESVKTGKSKNATKKPATDERKGKINLSNKPKKGTSKSAKSKTKSNETFVAGSSASPKLGNLKNEKKKLKTVLPYEEKGMSDAEDKDSLIGKPEVNMVVSDSEVDPVNSGAQDSTKRSKKLKKSLSDTEIHSLESDEVVKAKKTSKRQKKAETGLSNSEKVMKSDTVLAKKNAKGQEKQENEDKENDPVHSYTVLSREKKSNTRQKKQENSSSESEKTAASSDKVLLAKKKSNDLQKNSSSDSEKAAVNSDGVVLAEKSNTKQKKQKNSSSDSEKTAVSSDRVVLAEEKKSNNRQKKQKNSSSDSEKAANSDKVISAKEKKTAKKQEKGKSKLEKTALSPTRAEQKTTKSAKGLKKSAKKT